MTWNYTIHAERTGDATTVRGAAAATRPTSMWAIGPPPGDASPGWLIGLRFVVRDGYPVLAELRAFPDEGPSPEYAEAEWSGDPNTVPGLGLTAAAIKNLSVGTMENQVRAALSNPRDPVWGDDQDLVLIDGEPADNWIEWSGVTEDLEVDTADTASRNKRGRKPHPDELLALVAYYYTEALRSGVKVHNYVKAQIRTVKKNPNPGTLIKNARDRGFLTPVMKSGQKGGTLTPKAEAVLEASGLPYELPTQRDEHQGGQE